eukprot:CAMPEP_0170573144 /NCGR_PEP_ID=MMETSP0224-20130122/2606_1 /TAXON_ID=285029 /ORGANISM="Togula jolla, Strain CCCM 725" /LENGTH=51 /DNA_ID=CAMNT_0010895707 /DNA_START=169 /DNA_END=324 /DNA_ORIENTATION=-
MVNVAPVNIVEPPEALSMNADGPALLGVDVVRYAQALAVHRAVQLAILQSV